MKKSRGSLPPILAAALSLALLAGCQPAALPTVGATLALTTAPASPIVGPTVAPTPALASPIPAASPTATPALPATPGSSPLAIAAMRAKAYPGSDIVIESALPPGPGYKRYIVSYASDGLKLFGLLTVPTSQEPSGGWPVILLNHGYIPPAEYSTEESYAGIVAPLAAAGYIVFKPDYRGNGSSPGTACQPYICPDYVTDSLNALASIRKYKDANPNEVGVWGHSMGGNITLHELVITHDVKAAVLMAGVVGSYSGILDWWKVRVATGVLTTQNDLETDQLVNQLVSLHGTPQTDPAYWSSIDPTAFVPDLQAPVLIQVGTADTVVPPDFSRSLAAQLQSAGKTVRFHEYPGANHNLSPDTAAAVEEAIAFFDQYLK